MKILVLNGSPKRDKSDTMHITRAFLEGMKEAVLQDIHIINTIDQHIEYCTGCFSCMQNGGTCIHNDDMKAILEEWDAGIPEGSDGPHASPFQHGYAEGRRPVRTCGAGGFQPSEIPHDLWLRFSQQQTEL